MKYICNQCGNKCSVSLRVGHTPKVCVLSADRECSWKPYKESPQRSFRDTHITRCRKQDSTGIYVKRIDPSDPWAQDVVYRSISDAARFSGLSKGTVARAVKSRGKLRAGEFYWDYATMTEEQCRIKDAAQISLDAYRDALFKYDKERYTYVFGED